MRESSGRLVIPDGLHHNMDKLDEITISIGQGTGCTGTAYAERKQTFAVMRKNWGPHTLPQGVLAHVDPRLKWIISTPIPDPDVPGAVIGVFNVDGLDVAKERHELEVLVDDLVAVAQTVSAVFKSLN